MVEITQFPGGKSATGDGKILKPVQTYRYTFVEDIHRPELVVVDVTSANILTDARLIVLERLDGSTVSVNFDSYNYYITEKQ